MDAPEAGQEWLGGPYAILRNLRLLERSLRDIRDDGAPKPPGKPWTRADGQAAVRVFPTDGWDRLFFKGTTAEIWMDPALSLTSLPSTTAKAYQQQPKPGLSLVLSAGNVSSIGPMDAFYKLFVERRAVILKTHPVNAYLGPLLSRGFASLIEAGFVAVVHGDAEEGAYLCGHKLVDDIHITGSDKTHDLIVFGPDAEAAKASRKPLLTKPITSELGNVSPVIVAPGRWTDAQLRFQAENVAGSLVNNAGFNCNASRVLITHAGWPQRREFLKRLREVLAEIPTRPAYYPGAAARYEAFTTRHPEAIRIGETAGDKLPWTLIEDLDPKAEREMCFREEAFCGVFAETALPAASPVEFLDRAAAFANDKLWGTLNATLLVPPELAANVDTRGAVERCIAKLRYGTVAVNHWAAVGYAICATTWGAFPGHDLYNIVSGRGVVHNTYMFDRPQKSVVWGPFTPWPKPLWFPSHRGAALAGRRLAMFEAKPSLLKLPGVFAAALKS